MTSYLCIDFGSWRNGALKNTIFSTGLEDQYSNLASKYPNQSFDNFISLHFTAPEQTVFFSYPNFNREKKDVEKGAFYNNVAVRFPQKSGENDLVLMGDIYEKERDGHRQFRVKAILTIDPKFIPSGVEIKADKVTPVVMTQFRGQWSCNGIYSDWPTDDQKRFSTLTDDFMLKLHRSYVVKNPDAVLDLLGVWEKYIESRKYLIEEEAKKGYELRDCTPELLKAFSVDGVVPNDDVVPFKFLNNEKGKTIWSSERPDPKLYPNAKESLLLHLYVSFDKKQVEIDKETENIDQKKKFDSFTRNPNVLVDPSAPRDFKNKTKSYVVQIRDGRIAPSTTETVTPDEMIDELNTKREQEKSKAERDQHEAFRRAVKVEMDRYEYGELPALIQEELDDKREPVTQRVMNSIRIQIEDAKKSIIESIEKTESHIQTNISEMETLNKELEAAVKDNDHSKELLNKLKTDQEPSKKLQKEAEEKASKTGKKVKELTDRLSKYAKETDSLKARVEEQRQRLDGIDDSIDPEPRIKAELDKIRQEYKVRVLADHKEESERELKPLFEKERIRLQNAIDRTYDERIEEAKESKTILRYHVYYELDLEDTDSVDSVMTELQPKMHDGMFLRKDYTGDLYVLDRQEKSLSSLKNGYVMNPFLATALLTPDKTTKDEPVDLESVKYFTENLNDKQKEAIVKALSANGVFLLQGPPGTGKTQVIAEITAQLASSGRKVLIASENNKAVDNAFSRLPKIPSIRPMRIIADAARAKDNAYSMDNLLPNFYNNISTTLEKELRKYTDHENYMDELVDSLEELRSREGKIKRLTREAEELKQLIEEKKSELNAKYDEKGELEGKFDTVRNELMEIEERLSQIRDLSYQPLVERIVDELKGIGFEPGSYGEEKEVLRAIHSSSLVEIENEYADMEFHQELFDLRAKKESASPGEIAKINTAIEKYLSYNDLDESKTFRLLRKLNPIPEKDMTVRAKALVDKLYNEEESRHSTLISRKNGMIDSSKIDLLKTQISNLKEEIDEFQNDDAYKALEDATNEFDSLAERIMTNLNITISYSSPGQFIEKLDAVRKGLEREYKKNPGERMDKIDAYKRIIRYLRDEQVITDDSGVYRKSLLKTVNVFGMTCSSSNGFKDDDDQRVQLGELNIDVVLIDEVSKIPFVELLQPILYGKTVILVGDHKQLPPMFTERITEEEMTRKGYDPGMINPADEKRYKTEYETSFFAKLFNMTSDRNKTMLNVQYRMHPDIMDVDNVFYGGALISGIKAQAREHHLDITGAYGSRVIGPDTHVMFVDCKGREIQESGSFSYYNESEIRVVKALLDMINKGCRYDRDGKPLTGTVDRHHDNRLSVGVICPYADQAKRIRGRKAQKYLSFNDSGDEKFMVKTVDDFQGDERDIIILSMVRTRKSQFLENYHRINVAVSRARRLLIIVGNRKALEPMWVPMEDDIGKDPDKGLKLPIYRNMITTIERKNGVVNEERITGGE